ncbi:hypothetical protein MICRO80W_170015 [Micrococcus luteus]|nr:hypothetical protein MICRO80W_170015 [Micrococcus luteus]
MEPSLEYPVPSSVVMSNVEMYPFSDCAVSIESIRGSVPVYQPPSL